ncbi:hypothetical protein INQ30_23895, partial [Escherichia coli]|nr:hypothetical protein [Escherichia coli]
KGAPTIRELEALFREEFGLSHAQARAVAERRFKIAPRDEGSEAKHQDTAALSEVLSGFKLPEL